ncbi:MAG: hypothetical protein ISS72_03140 [Candidatus Brocadiae bacterium]|nr:hypothetical protein [Candidatus Brocadiia bacterium]
MHVNRFLPADRVVTAAIALALAAVLGCAPAAPRPEALLRDPAPATARQTSFRGWRGCIELSNRLVSVTCVPVVGGRTLRFALGSDNPLLIGKDECGQTLATTDGRPLPTIGGHSVRLHPEARWQELQSRAPAALTTAPYEAKILGEGAVSAVELTSPVDLASGTQLVRRVELFAGTTHVRITDKLTTVRLVPQEWGIHDVLQLKGHPRPSGVLRSDDTATGGLRLYVPLNPESQFRGGYERILPTTRRGIGGAPQWSSDALPGLLVLAYRREFSKIAVDPRLPWIAFSDPTRQYVFVQRCRVPRKEIVTAGGPIRSYPFIEVQSFAPAVRLGRGESTELVQDWYAARCPGPVVDVTDAGVVSAPLSLLRGSEGDTWAAGTFGAFVVGTAAIVFRDGKGKELGRLDCGVVSPFEPIVLHRRVELPPTTSQVALEVSGAEGKPVGHLGKILLGP